MNQAVHVCSTTLDPIAKLNTIRKVGGLVVACLEQHGAPHRDSDAQVPPNDGR